MARIHQFAGRILLDPRQHLIAIGQELGEWLKAERMTAVSDVGNPRLHLPWGCHVCGGFTTMPYRRVNSRVTGSLLSPMETPLPRLASHKLERSAVFGFWQSWHLLWLLKSVSPGAFVFGSSPFKTDMNHRKLPGTKIHGKGVSLQGVTSFLSFYLTMIIHAAMQHRHALRLCIIKSNFNHC